MENVAGSNAALMRRIVQLEKERDELQKDVETMCLQQSGVAGSVDVSTRMQARRAAGLEQELESYKEKAALLTRENHNLQEELTEVYRLKSRLTEAFKAAVEKNNQVEKEVKFYQSKVAAALGERDKAVVEVERVQESEKAMAARVQQLYNRLGEVEAQSEDRAAHEMALQRDLNTANAQLDLLYKVVDKFWALRESSLVASNEDDQPQAAETPADRAATLVAESDAQWAYGGPDPQAEEALRQEAEAARRLAEENRVRAAQEQARAGEAETQLVAVKEELEGTTRALQAQLAEERHAREQAVEKASTVEAQLEQLEKTSASKLQKLLEVQADHEDLRTKVDSLLEDERQWIAAMVADFDAIMEEMRASEVHPESVDKFEEERGPPPEEDVPSSPEDEEMLTGERAVELDDDAASPGAPPPEHVAEGEGAPAVSCTVSTSPTDDVEIVAEVMGEVHPVWDADTNEITITQEEHFSAVVRVGKSETYMDDESRKALAQALHEKVEALLLLSQQEERFYVESKTIQGLEGHIKDLNEKISQVTGEKVSALMEVAQLRQDCQRFEEREKELIRRLQLHRSTNASGRLMPASWSEPGAVPQVTREAPPPPAADRQLVIPKPSLITTGGYLKSWLRGMDVSGAGSLRAAPESTKRSTSAGTCSSSQTDESVDFAKLRVENAALQERVASVQRLTESAHRLRMTLTKAAKETESEEVAPPSLEAAMEVTKGVSAEAKRLRIALGCSLPVSSLPASSAHPAAAPDAGEGLFDDGEARVAVDVATAAGIEMVELLLAAAELQASGLQRRIDVHKGDT